MHIEKETQRFLDVLAAQGGPPIYTLSPEEARNVLLKAQRGSVSKPPAEVEDRTIPGGITGSVRLRIVRPAGEQRVLPAVLYFHGGGWILGDFETHERLVREIATGAGVVVIFVDYDRAPEAKYPVAIEQAYAATNFVAENGTELGLNAARLAVAGDSVGGNMAAAVTLLAKLRGGPSIKTQVLFYPVTAANFETDSYHEFANGPWLTREAMMWFWNAYLPHVDRHPEPTVAPLAASLEQLAGLPPALIITAENDVLRDEGEAYAHKLAEAGVRVTATRYLGTIHDFVMLNALSETPAARGAIEQANATIRHALQQD